MATKKRKKKSSGGVVARARKIAKRGAKSVRRVLSRAKKSTKRKAKGHTAHKGVAGLAARVTQLEHGQGQLMAVAVNHEKRLRAQETITAALDRRFGGRQLGAGK